MAKSILELDAPLEEKRIFQVRDGNMNETTDWIAREEPLEIKLEYGPGKNRTRMTLAITMRTPGNDYDLVRGFLFTEGIILRNSHIRSIQYDLDLSPAQQQLNSVVVSLAPDLPFETEKLNRHFYTSSSCGICGKTSIEMVRMQSSFFPPKDAFSVKGDVIHNLPGLLMVKQSTFQQTGGIHAAALVTPDGQLLHVEEDIGRHNAVDKLIGWAMTKDMLPLRNHILFVSGRAGFELVQKAVMAGVTMFVAIGAASSLAIELAQENQITLVGFLSTNKYNVYHGAERLE